jgi:DNA-binding transcriptional MerR regulator
VVTLTTVTVAAPDVEEYTVDALAARTGTTVRTLRFYAGEGLLPPPTRRGRTAVYDRRHRLRLELIRTFQDQGFTLSAIQRVLERIPDDAPPAEYAVQTAVLAPWLPGRTEELSAADLERRVGRRVRPAELDFLAAVGALERVGQRRYRVAPAVIGPALELFALPVPEPVLRECASIIGEHARAVADGLTEVFAHAIWGPYQRGELDHEQVAAILSRMRPLALQGLVGAFADAADAAARRGLQE